MNVIAVSEHWKSAEQLRAYTLPGYVLADCYCRSEGAHGGTAVYVQNGLNFTRRTDFNELSIPYTFECAAVELHKKNCKILIISIYRPPNSDINTFFHKMHIILGKILCENLLYILCADFNIDLFSNNRIKNDFVDLLNSYNALITVKESTRITETTKTCIDNVITNIESHKTQVIDTHISDHLAIIFTFYCEKTKETSVIKRRLINAENIAQFLNLISNESWSEVYKVPENDVNGQYVTFINIFKYYFDISFPFKQSTMQHRKQNSKHTREPEVLLIKNQLDAALVISRNYPKYKPFYKKLKKDYDETLTKHKKAQLENVIQNAHNPNKVLWNVVKTQTALGKRKEQFNFNHFTNLDNLANDFNNFFINVVPNMLLTAPSLPFQCNVESNPKSMYMFEVTEIEILDTLKKIKSKDTYGHDEISTNVMKSAIPLILKPIMSLLNNSFKHGIFPSDLKTAVVVPIYKKDNKSEISNYRPISLLPSFSKIFEKIISARIINFFSKFNLFNNKQHGFVKSKSINTAMFELTQSIENALENKELPLGLFLDLSKAFDCVSSEILLKKLFRYGIRGNVWHWIKSYLEKREQYVEIKQGNIKYASEKRVIQSGVPQGSILGPLLFIIYINDLSDVLLNSRHNILHYADDTTIIFKDSSLDNLKNELNEYLPLIENWLLSNKLFLNLNKTQCVAFTTVRNKLFLREIDYRDTTIKIKASTKCLGITLDSTLNWTEHIIALCSKLASVIYCFKVVYKLFNLKTMKLLYFANFQSLLQFGIPVWGGASDVGRVFKLQKSALRTILGLSYRTSCRGIFKRENILTVSALYILECLIFNFKNKHYYDSVKKRHDINVRNVAYVFPKHHLSHTEKSMFYMSIRLFNSLPRCIQCINRLQNFTVAVKSLLNEIEPYSVNEFLLKCGP